MDNDFLVSAARSGDASAFNELYLRHSKAVLKTIYRVTKNREDAEHALQEAGMRAFLYMKGFEGKASFSSWLTTIAINSALILLRKKRGGEISIEQLSTDYGYAGAWEFGDDAESPEKRYLRCEREASLWSSIQRLPGIYREILELQLSHEYSSANLAKELGISLSATKSRLLRARKRLHRTSHLRPSGRSNSTRESSAASPLFHS